MKGSTLNLPNLTPSLWAYFSPGGRVGRESVSDTMASMLELEEDHITIVRLYQGSCLIYNIVVAFFSGTRSCDPVGTRIQAQDQLLGNCLSKCRAKPRLNYAIMLEWHRTNVTNREETPRSCLYKLDQFKKQLFHNWLLVSNCFPLWWTTRKWTTAKPPWLHNAGTRIK